MNEFLSLLSLVGGIALAVLAVFLVGRGLVERRRAYWQKRLFGAEDEPGLIADTSSKPQSQWARNMDQAFTDMVKRTGLGWAAGQALGLMALAGVVAAGVLLLWRENLWLVGVGLF